MQESWPCLSALLFSPASRQAPQVCILSLHRSLRWVCKIEKSYILDLVDNIKDKTKQKQPLNCMFLFPWHCAAQAASSFCAVVLCPDFHASISPVTFLLHSWILCLLPKDAALVHHSFPLTLSAHWPTDLLHSGSQFLPFSRCSLAFLLVNYLLSCV